MTTVGDGRAIVYCQDAFLTPTGKTAHGLIRRTRRYEILSVIDRSCAGRDAAEVLDGKPKGIPIHVDLASALEEAVRRGKAATHFVIGLAPDGGRLDAHTRSAAHDAIGAGLNVDSGLHDFLADDEELSALAKQRGVLLRDVRRTPPRSQLHPFMGKISEVAAFRVAVLGTDSAIGKRTTAWVLVDGLNARGVLAELVGTGQTAWMQGARFSIILDSLINDFVAGELEHAVWSAWKETRCEIVVIEGQGSLMHPAYPGGFEILAAAKPDAIVLQHAPARHEYDGFPGQSLHPLNKQIQAVELLADRPVVAITINHERLTTHEVQNACAAIQAETGIPTTDVLLDGPDVAVAALLKHRLKCCEGRRG